MSKTLPSFSKFIQTSFPLQAVLSIVICVTCESVKVTSEEKNPFSKPFPALQLPIL